MSIVVPDGNKCLEPGLLVCMYLLLHRHDLQNLVFEGCPQEQVNDLRFLDRWGEEVDLLQGLDLHVLDQVDQLGEGDSLLVVFLASMSSVPQVPTKTLAQMLLPNPPWKKL